MLTSKQINYGIALAELTSHQSKDRSTKVGAVIMTSDGRVISTGYNGFPRRVNDNVNSRHLRPAKYKWTEHAERNAIYNAAYQGIRLAGTYLLCNWRPPACSDCARGIIQTGIRAIIGSEHDFPSTSTHWKEEHDLVFQMLAEAGVAVWMRDENDNLIDLNLEGANTPKEYDHIQRGSLSIA